MQSSRDTGFRRLRRATAMTFAGAGALALAFAGLAARALPGRHAATTARVRAAATTTTTQRATPPPLVPVQGSDAPAASSPQASAPVQSQAPPVAVSGGT